MWLSLGLFPNVPVLLIHAKTVCTSFEVHHIPLICLSQWNENRSGGATLWPILRARQWLATLPPSGHSDYGQNVLRWSPPELTCLSISDEQTLLLTCTDMHSGQGINFCCVKRLKLNGVVRYWSTISLNTPIQEIITLTEIKRLNYKKSSFVYKKNMYLYGNLKMWKRKQE